jgi:hypothetical protein
MTDSLYPVPQPSGVAEGRSRLQPVLAAEITATGILRGRAQPDGVVARPQLLIQSVAVVAPLPIPVLLRGRAHLDVVVPRSRLLTITFPDAPPLTSPSILRGRQPFSFDVTPLPSRLRVGIPQAPGTGVVSITFADMLLLATGTVAVSGVVAITFADMTLVATGTPGTGVTPPPTNVGWMA